jgi:nucleolar protein 14
MITESKKRKFETQKDKEDNIKLTTELDTQWKEMGKNLKMSGSIYTKKFHEKDEEDGEEVDAYNKLMNELVFEPKKAPAQDRLKTDEEIVLGDKERLEKLEKLRLKRMTGDVGQEDSEEGSDEEGSDEEGSEDEKGTTVSTLKLPRCQVLDFSSSNTGHQSFSDVRVRGLL